MGKVWSSVGFQLFFGTQSILASAVYMAKDPESRTPSTFLQVSFLDGGNTLNIF